MLATEARKNACERIWNSLPCIIRNNIKDAVNKGNLKCKIRFGIEETDNLNECTKYFNDLKELGYIPMKNKIYDKYVITIMW